MKALLVYFRGYVKDSILGTPFLNLIEASFELLGPSSNCWNCRHNYSK